MMRPRRIAAGADHQLLLGLLGAKVALRHARDAIAWLTAGAANEPGEAEPALVDLVLGIAALAGAIDRETATRSEVCEPSEIDDAQNSSARSAVEDLLR